MDDYREHVAQQDAKEHQKNTLRVQVRAYLQRLLNGAKSPLRVLLALELPVDGGDLANDAQAIP